ncbi:hypothetical protein BO78DRAFT_11664 [Aspergillus sclerotiicarbonarius CBS 121057]|uniref:Uncharacterized protein n=1 Tax=Aspergillus sclerotiicarbonarius (strain CBS 121057 / IBT 28362) TaxID=1448318 RepID=A0A319EKY3_ASPSB|nr:hypothetical protein BO78DRAFT_11664 [Aspergillus sclerotiicarbonarius CBS 121057]
MTDEEVGGTTTGVQTIDSQPWGYPPSWQVGIEGVQLERGEWMTASLSQAQLICSETKTTKTKTKKEKRKKRNGKKKRKKKENPKLFTQKALAAAAPPWLAWFRAACRAQLGGRWADAGGEQVH